MMNGRFGEIDSEGVAALQQLFPTVHNEAVPVETLRKMQRSAYWRFYLKPRPMLNLGKRMTNWSNVKKVSRAIRRRVFAPAASPGPRCARRRRLARAFRASPT